MSKVQSLVLGRGVSFDFQVEYVQTCIDWVICISVFMSIELICFLSGLNMEPGRCCVCVPTAKPCSQWPRIADDRHKASVAGHGLQEPHSAVAPPGWLH